MWQYSLICSDGRIHFHANVRQQSLYKMRYLLREHGKGYWNWDLVHVIKPLKIEKPKVLFYLMFPDFRRSTAL